MGADQEDVPGIPDFRALSVLEPRGISTDQYMSGNLLGVEVIAKDVASAFLHLALLDKVNAATLTMDAGDISRASFYCWKAALQRHGQAAPVRKKPIPKNPKNRTPPEIGEKVLHLLKTYHLGPMRIVWYLARYHHIRISGAGISRILKRHGLNRLPAPNLQG